MTTQYHVIKCKKNENCELIKIFCDESEAWKHVSKIEKNQDFDKAEFLGVLPVVIS